MRHCHCCVLGIKRFIGERHAAGGAGEGAPESNPLPHTVLREANEAVRQGLRFFSIGIFLVVQVALPGHNVLNAAPTFHLMLSLNDGKRAYRPWWVQL